jgi:hypothetical protein
MPEPPIGTVTALDDAMGEVLAVVRSYDELRTALRARVDQLGISLETLDDLCGFWPAYSSHLLGPQTQGNMRALGKMSLGAALGALGLKLIVAHDENALAKIRHRLVQRDNAQARRANTHPPRIELKENVFTVLGRAGGYATAARLSAKQRVRNARKAIRARWSRAREAAR